MDELVREALEAFEKDELIDVIIEKKPFSAIWHRNW